VHVGELKKLFDAIDRSRFRDRGDSLIMAPMRTGYPAGISRNTVLRAFASLFADISSEMLYSILPIFLTQVLHASGSVVGVVEGIAEATQDVVQGFSGWLSDKLHSAPRDALAAAGIVSRPPAQVLIRT
jgi:hypothetical protein